MSHCTRVLTKLEAVPELEELEEVLLLEHPGSRLEVEDEDEEGNWNQLLLTSIDGIEIAVLARLVVEDGSEGQDELADLLEDARDAGPESAFEWLENYTEEVQTVFRFTHLQGAEFMQGAAALHALRHKLFERGESILQADREGFTNEEGYHILWQFEESVSGSWNMAILEDDAWRNFTMDLGDPEHRDAFLAGLVPDDVSEVRRRS